MQLTEKHIVKSNHSLFNECEKLCFASKNIYNRSLYLIKKDYEEKQSYETLNNLYNVIKTEECYSQLPPKVAQNTIRTISTLYKAFFQSIKSDNVKHKVSTPKFKHKTNGRFMVTFNNQTISKKVFKKANHIKLSSCDIEFFTKIDKFECIDCVRITPVNKYQYAIEVVYTVEDTPTLKSNKRYAAIDLGLNNLATLTSNTKELRPMVFNGKPLKSINHYYNRKYALIKSTLSTVNNKKSSHKLNKLNIKRTNKIADYLHKTSKEVIQTLVSHNITKLVIGYNKEWKQDCNLGKVTNQNFVSIPYSRFISQLTYKCEKVGIHVLLHEESYTSKCSFLDGESIEKHETYCGKRIKRGLFRSSNGRILNADVNGSYNILKKAFPNAFGNGIQGVVVHPSLTSVSVN